MDNKPESNRTTAAAEQPSVWEVLKVSTGLGLTSFGGPAAHLGYFREAYVKRRQWLDERSYADLVALCQFLPGPASSQVGIGVGLIRAGLPGAFAAWIGFTLPSVIAMILFAMLLQGYPVEQAGWIHGLKIAAVAIVAQAVLGMGKSLAPDRGRATIAVLAAAAGLLWPTAWTQIVVIAGAGLLGWLLYAGKPPEESVSLRIRVSRKLAAASLTLFFAGLLLLPLMRGAFTSLWLAIFDSFYRAGALVFGGGHVVLPLLQREVVPEGWVDNAQFLAGYGAAQAVPGPLFTFSAYLGTMTAGLGGAAAAVAGIFLPAFLLVIGILPFWESIRRRAALRGALAGINAAVVGILLAALYNPIATSAITQPADFALAAVLFVMLVIWKLPPWIVVMWAAVGGTVIAVFL